MLPFLDVEVREKRYADRLVFRDLRLQVAPTEIVALVGASGCGKSTLLRIVAGLDTRYDGRVRLEGRVVSGPTGDIGFVFQEPRLLPWLTVGENIAFETGRGGASAHDHPRVHRLLAEVGLPGLERALPKALSGGQAQRVAIARGLFREPRLLLLDEPFSAVDALTRIRLQRLLLDVATRHAVTILLVTHDVDEAIFLGHRVVVLDAAPRGIVAQCDVQVPRPRELDDPRSAPLRRRVLETLERASAATVA